MMQWIEDALRELGITANYRGYRWAVTAIKLILEDENRLCAVTKEVYYDVGRLNDCKWSAVEHALRTVVGKAWQTNPERLREMAGYRLENTPTTSEFLDIVSNYIRRKYYTGKTPVGSH